MGPSSDRCHFSLFADSCTDDSIRCAILKQKLSIELQKFVFRVRFTNNFFSGRGVVCSKPDLLHRICLLHSGKEII